LLSPRSPVVDTKSATLGANFVSSMLALRIERVGAEVTF
jgi:hypothetical protein